MPFPSHPGAFQLDSLHLEAHVPPFILTSPEVPKGFLVGVVGPTGSGKSSLLQAILGEMPKAPASGPARVADQRPVAFLPQQPWIFNSTVRQNVLFGETYSEVGGVERWIWSKRGEN